MRLTYDEQTQRLTVHAPLGERALSAAEAQQIREALEAPRLPAWLEYGSVIVGVLAMVILGRGGGH